MAIAEHIGVICESTGLKQATWRRAETWNTGRFEAFNDTVFMPVKAAVSIDGKNWWSVRG